MKKIEGFFLESPCFPGGRTDLFYDEEKGLLCIPFPAKQMANIQVALFSLGDPQPIKRGVFAEILGLTNG